jgi:hypothetical protein
MINQNGKPVEGRLIEFPSLSELEGQLEDRADEEQVRILREALGRVPPDQPQLDKAE